MSLKLFGVPIRVHPLVLPAVALALYMGEGVHLLAVSTCILLHELSHIAVARWMRIRVAELELMPFGGAARMESLWMIRPGQVIAVALAGPACNLLIAMCASALCWWGVLDGWTAALLLKVNLVIMLFNLLPALPLDGGRVLCGLLSIKLTPERATAVGVWTGRVLAGVLLIAAVATALNGQFNLTLALAGTYLMLSGQREMRQADGAAIRSLIDRQRELSAERVLPMQWLAASRDLTVREVIRRMRPRRAHMVAVFDGQMHMMGYLSERRLIDALMKDGGQPLGALLLAAGGQQRANEVV